MRSDIQTYIRSRQPGVQVITDEDTRVIAQLIQVAASLGMGMRTWTATGGLVDVGVETADATAAIPCPGPQDAIIAAAGLSGRQLVVFRRFHFYLDPTYREYVEVVGLLSDALEMLKSVKKDEMKTFVFLSPMRRCPDELKDLISTLQWPRPTLDEVQRTVQEISTARSLTMTAEEIDAAASASLGLSATAAENCFARCLIQTGSLDPGEISQQKRALIEASGLLTYIQPEGGLELIAGLENLKKWAMDRRRAFSVEAQKYGLRPPRGVVISGVSGCGKSKLVECLISAWQMVGVSLDMGSLFSKWQGDSEGNVRAVQMLLESIAPVIVRIDEFEKGFSGMGGGGDTDGGTANRVFQSLLTWMGERKAPSSSPPQRTM